MQLNWDGRANAPVSSSWALKVSPGFQRLSGTCVVAGFGSTLFSDLARVKEVRGDLPTIAVNMAAGYVKAFAAFSMHWDREHLGKWAEQQREAFGDGFTVHAEGKPEWLKHNLRNYPHVGFWWDGVMSKGSSGWAAARLAKAMGFSEVILCGVPIDHGRYANGGQAILFQSPQTNSVCVFRKAIELDSETRSGTYSLSGWTKDLLGVPPGF
jgi:hypothetical protein